MSSSYGHWSEVTLAEHPADVFEPAKPNPHGFVVIYLHGVHLQRLMGNEAFVAPLARYGLHVVAPHTGPCWWVDRISPAFDPHRTPEQHIVKHVLPWIEERYGARPPRIALLGTSMGGQGALRYAFRHPNLFPIAAAISPAIDFQYRIEEGDTVLGAMYSDREAARQDTALLHVHALNWPRNIWFACDPADHRWHDSSDRLRMKLGSLGIPQEYDLETTGGGHGFEYYNRMAEPAIRFIAERLERERMRLV